MALSNPHSMKYFSMSFLRLLFFALLIVWNTALYAVSVAKPVGGPIRISPPPGSPDPILQNLVEVMKNHYQLPYYPGGSPDYLSDIFLTTNTYTADSRGIAINPVDDRVMCIQIGQNLVIDSSGTFQTATIGTNTFARSFDGGQTWSYGPPIEQIIPLGGTISQIVNASLGPGLYLEYDKKGKLYASGNGFFDMVANPPNAVPLTGFLFTSSEDNGIHWDPVRTILSSDLDWWFIGGPFSPMGVGPREFYTTIDPANNNLIHCSTQFTLFTNYLWGNLFYFRSKNKGRNFSTLREVYSIIDDPVWKAKYFDPNFTSDPNYFVYGGICYCANHPVVYDHNILFLPIVRAYPKMGSSVYLGAGYPSASTDQALVRSFDRGKTWSKVAGATDQFIFPTGTADPGLAIPPSSVLAYFDSTDQEAQVIVSPFTGRVYLAYGAGNPSASPPYDESVIFYFPYVLLSASSDQGATWSHAVQINRTPTNLSIGQQIAFCSNATMTKDGHLLVAYYDFRNWTGFPGENFYTTPLQTDVWIDVYKEVDDPTGGSTRIGLDFVEEIRVTPQSFNARISGAAPGSLFITGTTEGLGISVNNNNVVYLVYSLTGSFSDNVTVGYKGMSIETDNLTNIYLQRYQFPKPSNE